MSVLNVERRSPGDECGARVGTMVLKIEGLPDFQTVAFNCTKPRLHRDACAFEGVELRVSRKRP